MVFVLVSLSVFKLTQLFREWIMVPAWVLILAVTGLSAGGLWIAGDNPAWCLAVAAIAGFTHRFDGFLQAGTDWVRILVLSRGHRR